VAVIAQPNGHGSLPASEVGDLIGVSGTTVGQWARRGYIRSSQGEEEPRRYSVEDVAEAAIVRTLLGRGVPHAEVRRAVVLLRRGGEPWPLTSARLATARGPGGRTRLFVAQSSTWLELTRRGWQAVAPPEDLREVPLRLRRRGAP
jgi:hypothetical protein